MSIGTQRVPFEGPSDYKILIVGESPGQVEVGQGRPFVGPSGQLLERYLNRSGILRSQVKLTNLCQFQPKYNKFESLLGSSQLQEGVEELTEEIQRGEPNLILALGNWPMFYLTGACGTKNKKANPGSGIHQYRGSVLPALASYGPRKVFCTFHPAFVSRSWFWNPVFNIDIGAAIRESAYPDIRLPPIEEHIDPPSDQLLDLVREAKGARWVAMDIETFPTQEFSCVGFSYQRDGLDVGVCVTYQRPDLWRFAKEVWESDVPKIFQFGTYDDAFMRRFYRWKLGGFYRGVGWDTYVASANLLPDYPRNLGFLMSIYTPFPFHKDDRELHKKTGDMMSLWRYNIKDNVGTMHTALNQMEEMEELYGHDQRKVS